MALQQITSETWQGYESVSRIEELMAIGVTVTAVAKRFGVSRQAIYDVLKKKKDGAPTGLPSPSSTPATSANKVSGTSVPGEES